MNIYTLSPSSLARGGEAFRTGIRQYLGSTSEFRGGGAEIIPGAISAAVRAGIVGEKELIRIVARVSRCNDAAVSTVLHALADDHVVGRLWSRDQKGVFIPRGSVGRVPAAFLVA